MKPVKPPIEPCQNYNVPGLVLRGRMLLHRADEPLELLGGV